MRDAEHTLKAEVQQRTTPELQTSQSAWYDVRKAPTSMLLFRLLLHPLPSLGPFYIDEMEIATLSWPFAELGRRI